MGQDFSTADKGRKFSKGGDTMAKMNPFMAMMAKKKDAAKGMPAKKMANGGSASSRADGIAIKGKTKGKLLNKGSMAC